MRSGLGQPREDLEDDDRAVNNGSSTESESEAIEEPVAQHSSSREQLINVTPAAVSHCDKRENSIDGNQPTVDNQSTGGNQPTIDSQSTGLSSNVKRTLIIGGAAAATGLGAVVAAPLILGAAGFGAAGVAAGSIAAGWQAAIGNVVAGSLFASLQSAGVLGLASSTVAAVGAVGATGGAVATGVVTKLMDKNGSNNGEPGPSSLPTSANPGDDDETPGFAPDNKIVPTGKL